MNQDVLNKIINLRHELHAYPELSGEESWTKKHLIDFIQTNTNLTVVDKGKWFYAKYSGGGQMPPIGFRTEIDALPIYDNIDKPYASTIPGHGHKCGHDGHAAGLCGLAIELEEKHVERDVYLIFQHAEENGAGGKECEVFIPETGVVEIFAYHNTSGLPFKTVELYRTNYACASMGMNISMTGATTHASTPEKGISPVDALCRVACEIPKIADQKKYQNLVLATIVEVRIGAHAFGIAPAKGNIGVTLRALIDNDMIKIRDEIIEFAEREAAKHSLMVEFSYEDVFPETINNEESTEKVKMAAEKCGFPIHWVTEPNRGSEDFGWFLKQTKGAIFEMSCNEVWPELHNEEFDFDDKLIPEVTKLFMALAEM